MKIYRDNNYIIVEDGTVPTKESAVNRTVYQDTPQSFDVTTIDTNQITIVRIQHDDITAGLWEDDLGTLYTIPTMLAFLRGNTGFNAATGGSVADITSVDGSITVTNSTGPIVDLSVNKTLHRQTAYVDADYGDDLTGVVEDEDKPFASIQAAINASSGGGNVVVRPGSYPEYLVLKDNVDIIAFGNVDILGVTDSNVPVTCKIIGNNKFIFNGNDAILILAASNVYIKCYQIISTGTAIDLANITATQNVVIECDTVVSSSNYLIRLQGNSHLNLKVRQYISSGAGASSIILRQGFVGNLNIEADTMSTTSRMLYVSNVSISGTVNIKANKITSGGILLYMEGAITDVNLECKDITTSEFIAVTTAVSSGNININDSDIRVLPTSNTLMTTLSVSNIHLSLNDTEIKADLQTLSNTNRLFSIDGFNRLDINDSKIIINILGGTGDIIYKTNLNSKIIIKDSDIIVTGIDPINPNPLNAIASDTIPNGSCYFRNTRSNLDSFQITDVAVPSGLYPNDSGLLYTL